MNDITAISYSSPYHRIILLGVVLLTLFMSVLDGNAVNIALPAMTSFFQVDITASQLVTTVYLAILTSLLLLFGKISENSGGNRIFQTGLVVFTVGSLVCGLSDTFPELIVCRIIQAVGSAMSFAIGPAILFQSFPRNEQGKVMGLFGATIAIASIAGPALGGFLVDALGWQYIFFINVPIGIILIPFSLKYVNKEEKKEKRDPIDWIGAVFFTGMVISGIFFLTSIEWMNGLLILFLFATTIAFCILFIMQEFRSSHPLLDPALVRVPSFFYPLVSVFLFFIAMSALSITAPFYFQGVLHLSTTEVGLIFLIYPVIMAIVTPLGGWLYDKKESRSFVITGLIITVVSYFGFAWVGPMQDLTLILLFLVLMAFGGSLFYSPNNTDIMRGLPVSQINAASSISGTARYLSMVLGSSLGSVLLSVDLMIQGSATSIMTAEPLLLATAMGHLMVIAGIITFSGLIPYLLPTWKTGR